MLTLTFLGVGSAFAKRNFQSNALIESWDAATPDQAPPDENLLIDFGATGPLALYHLRTRPGFEYLDSGGRIHYQAIQRIFVSHLHGDHVAGLEELAAMTRHGDDHPTRPVLYAPAPILAGLWENTLRGGLGALPGRLATLEDYFRPHPLDQAEDTPTEVLTLVDRYRIEAFATDHIRIRERFDWPSCGLRITDRQSGRSVVFSGDTRFDPDRIGAMMAEADRSFHEVQLDPANGSVHTRLDDLRTLPAAVRRTTTLYHFSDDCDDDRFAFVPDEFAGFAVPQQRYVLFDGAQ